VLEILLTQPNALGAYVILNALCDEGLGSQPPFADRALDFLIKNGFAHKIERLNAFIACRHPGQSHTPAFLICGNCPSVAEAHSKSTLGMLGKAAKETGFKIGKLWLRPKVSARIAKRRPCDEPFKHKRPRCAD
jgi:Fur family zinc uptake transcriptional regulator